MIGQMKNCKHILYPSVCMAVGNGAVNCTITNTGFPLPIICMICLNKKIQAVIA